MEQEFDERRSFEIVFGGSPVIKVLDFLLDNREFDYSLTDIAKGAGIGWTTLHQFWSEMVSLGLVRRTRRIGRAELYKLDVNNPLSKKLIEIDFLVSKMMVRKELKRQAIKHAVVA